jgi:hypothetical protein
MSDDFTRDELHVLYVMIGRGYRPGSFTVYLINAVAVADMQNKAKLKVVFPEVVEAVDAYQNGDLYDRYMAMLKEQKHAEDQS